MSADADITNDESRLLRAYALPQSPVVFTIRAIALLVHTTGAPNVHRCSHASMSHLCPLGLLS